MDVNEFAAKIKAKYPEYKDIDNKLLSEKIVAKYPEYKPVVSFEASEQPDNSWAGAAKRALSPDEPEEPTIMGTAGKAAEAIANPFGSLAGLIKNRQTVFNQGPAVGATIGAVMGGGIPGAALGAGAGEALKQLNTRALGTPEAKAKLPQTSQDAAVDIGVEGAKGAAAEFGGKLAGGLAAKAWPMLKNAGTNVLKKILSIGGKVPDKAIEAGAKAGWKIPASSPEEVTEAVTNVQSALKNAVDDAGSVLDKAKSEIGIPTTVEERKQAVKRFGNVFGIGKADLETGALTQYLKDHGSREALSTAATDFIEQTKGLPPQTRAKVAQHLQDRIKKTVDWEGKEDTIGGLLKQQYQELGDVVSKALPKEIRTRMSNALKLEHDLGKILGEGEGKAEQALKNLFMSKSAAAKDTLQRLVDLEVFTGEPVLQELFKKFSGQELNKLVGREFIAFTAGSATMGGIASGNPTIAGTGLALLTGQSPWAMTRLGRLGVKGSGVAEKTAPAALRGFKIMAQNAELESVKNKLKGRK